MQSNSPFQIFKSSMESDDLSLRINTIHQLPIIATLIGPESIKSVLIPYLDSLSKKQDDEVVFAIAEQYANITPMLGNQHTIVLSYLENLCSHDETVIRERSVESITELCSRYSDTQINNFIVPLIIRLASNEANFTSRVSATALIPNVYQHAGQNKEKLRTKFVDISNQEMLLMQRATASKIPQLCRVYEKEYVLSDLINLLKYRASDQQDQIRVLAVESFTALSKVLSRDENKTYILPLLIQASEDKSWRVRLCLAKNFTEIGQNFGKEINDLSLIQVFTHLLKDIEPDVKIEAVKSLDLFIKIVSPNKMSVLIPQVVALGTDARAIVRSNNFVIEGHCGIILSAMIKFVEKDEAYQTIQPLIKDLLKDENQEVRKGGLYASTKFIQILGADSINAFLPSFKKCLEDPKWRVRLELLRNISDLAVNLNNSQTYFKHLEQFFCFYLYDRASAIRKEGVSKLPSILTLYSKQELNEFYNKLANIINKELGYHYKITALYSLKTICMDPANEQFVEKCIELMKKGSGEKVANIRQVCVKCLHDMLVRWDKGSFREQMKKQLILLSEDKDEEVSRRAKQIISRL